MDAIMDAKVVYVEGGANDNYSIMMSGLFRQLLLLLFGSGQECRRCGDSLLNLHENFTMNDDECDDGAREEKFPQSIPKHFQLPS